MSKIILTRGDDGHLCGVDRVADRAYRRFVARVKDMVPGDTVTFSFRIPRSPGFHKRHFKIIGTVFDQQDNFDNKDKFREWLQVGAGFCDLMPGPKGKPVAIPRSIAWESLDEAAFEAHHNEVITFLRSTYCTRWLWPHLTDLKADELINNIIGEFGA